MKGGEPSLVRLLSRQGRFADSAVVVCDSSHTTGGRTARTTTRTCPGHASSRVRSHVDRVARHVRFGRDPQELRVPLEAVSLSSRQRFRQQHQTHAHLEPIPDLHRQAWLPTSFTGGRALRDLVGGRAPGRRLQRFPHSAARSRGCPRSIDLALRERRKRTLGGRLGDLLGPTRCTGYFEMPGSRLGIVPGS